MRHALAAIALAVWSAAASAQWVHYPTKGIPRTADGKPDLGAPAPRTHEGKPDLSGVWQAMPDPTGVRGGIEDIVAPRYMIDITRDMKPEAVPFTPWAAAIYKQRNDVFRVDNPSIKCLPLGVPRLDAYTHPYKIIQTPDVVVVLYESMTTFRQIHLDGRPHPKNPQPAWYGYSIGKWVGDALVVETIGFNDRTWLDGSGHPHSEEMRLTERFKRSDFGHMNIEVTIVDPKAYTKPLSYTQAHALQPDTDLLEYVCENVKDVPR